MNQHAFFVENSPNMFQANPPAIGPWSAQHCHAGPVAGVVARALEQTIPDKMIARLTLELNSPVPAAGFSVHTELRSNRRNVATASAEIRDQAGQICVTAQSLHVAEKAYDHMPTPAIAPIAPPDGQSISNVLPTSVHDSQSFQNFVDVQLAKGEKLGIGPKTVWMTTPPLLANEPSAPIPNLCVLADCGNGLSYNASTTQMSFINADLTIHIHRRPASDILASQTISYWQTTGIGLSNSVLHDKSGPVAVALQTLILKPV